MAVVVLIVFTVPTVFQSIHILNHYNKSHQHSSCSQNKKIPEKQAANSFCIQDINYDDCAICDFDLADLKEQKKPFFPEPGTLDYLITKITYEDRISPYFKGNLSFLRAPPQHV